jgi:uncharacterized glyoxalase superfamily protein PhnB
MNKKVRPVPTGFHTVTPYLIVKGAAAAIEFYKQAFNAKELSRGLSSDGETIVHASLKIGNSVVFLADEIPGLSSQSPTSLMGSSVVLHLYVPAVDKLWNQALEAGGQELLPLQEAFWGDRYGQLMDPYGHRWTLASRVENLSTDEIAERAQELFPAEEPVDLVDLVVEGAEETPAEVAYH